MLNCLDSSSPELFDFSEESNPLECISNGALAGMQLVIAISANLVAVLALLGFIDSILLYLGELIGQGPWTLEILLGYVMFPVAFVMGVTENVHETLLVARLIGTKTAVNEFVAYKKLGELISSESEEISPRSAMIATYALCGFSNFCTIGITLGILGGLAPSKKSVLSRTISRALFTGCICCLYTATLAGIIVDEPTLCRPSAMASACFSTADNINKTLSE
ncbi:Na+ dependent nucleoside transporter [Ancylostoma caninum]|uniref:Na+ dependent nucleoside transporter n=1 Tax=Ancylostoma caninum TaxID=29170 RepID=A0A368GET9_ANCCA|nr:Na+ dependent nucleoside transporter [Ancylostoma caninum]